MSRDSSETVARLLALAADGANEHEAAVAAVQAARLFKREKLVLKDSDPASDACIMCHPATFAGICTRCGHQGACPGHACANPEPNTLCRNHVTWLDVAKEFARKREAARGAACVSQSPYAPSGAFAWGSAGGPVHVHPSIQTAPGSEDLRLLVERLRRENTRLREALSEDRRVAREKEKDTALFWPIGELGLSPRSTRALRAAGIALVGDLVRLTREEVR
jgi:hypothetical protein